jgi:hypothetical protein
MAKTLGMSRQTSEALLYLTDEQLRQGIEAMFFAFYRGSAMGVRTIGPFISSTAHRAPLLTICWVF